MEQKGLSMSWKIVVPEGMAEAYQEAAMPLIYGQPPSMVHDWRAGLRAALEWLAENPIEPTVEQARAIYNRAATTSHIVNAIRETMIEWQRHMFLEKEPKIRDVVRETFSRIRGLTLTPEEGDFIMANLNGAIHGGSKWVKAED